jgi:hypothetical protein
MTHTLLCDRCHNTYAIHQFGPSLCIACAVANQSAETRHTWARPTTHAEITAAATKAINRQRVVPLHRRPAP